MTPVGVTEYYYGLLQYYECCPLQDSIDEAIGCVCLPWVTSDSDYNTISQLRTSRNVVMGGEWLGLIPIQAVEVGVHFLRENMAIQAHTPKLPWTEHRIYINRFHVDLKEGRLD